MTSQSRVFTVKQDDVFNYQCSVLDLGLIVFNFFNAVSAGDGERVIRCWKFMLPYLKQDGARSRKYALEAFYLLCQVHVLLSPCDSHRLIWNRFHKSKFGIGGNIPLDLALEHYNNTLKNITKHLGPNSTNKRVIGRFCKALTVSKKLMQNFDKGCAIFQRSGKHVAASSLKDLKKVVSNLIQQRAMTELPGRKYSCYSEMQPSLIEGFDVHSTYKWIGEHKKLVYLNKAGR